MLFKIWLLLFKINADLSYQRKGVHTVTFFQDQKVKGQYLAQKRLSSCDSINKSIEYIILKSSTWQESLILINGRM